MWQPCSTVSSVSRPSAVSRRRLPTPSPTAERDRADPTARHPEDGDARQPACCVDVVCKPVLYKQCKASQVFEKSCKHKRTCCNSNCRNNNSPSVSLALSQI